MRRLYNMRFEISEFDNERADKIVAALEDIWHLDFIDKGYDLIQYDGDDSLCGGETEDEFARRAARDVMEANGGPCVVELIATYLQDLPSETYRFDEEDYGSLIDHEQESGVIHES